jgi:predicted protein tyrosine phosphatase
MAQAKKLLFVCSLNQRRSTTAEWIFKNFESYEVKSAGTEPGARVALTPDLIAWADLIFVMEQRHIQRLRRYFKSALSGKRLICLQIPDRHGGMSLELIKTLRERLSPYVQLPR